MLSFLRRLSWRSLGLLILLLFAVCGRLSTRALEQFEALHNSSEAIRHTTDQTLHGINIKGTWGYGYADWPQYPKGCNHPLIRDAGRRILGYLDAYRANGDTTYRNRAKDALDYLLREKQRWGDAQTDSSEFFYYWANDTTNSTGCAEKSNSYPTAIASVALVEGYRVFPDSAHYIAAAESTTVYQIASCKHLWPKWKNANYLGFQAWHLSTLYVERDSSKYLDEAIDRCLLIKDQQTVKDGSGFWRGDKTQVWYHGITLRGLITTWAIVPTSQDSITLHDSTRITYADARDSIKVAVERGITNLLARKKESGFLQVRCDPISGQPAAGDALPDPHALHALILAKEYGCHSSTQRRAISRLISRIVRRITETNIEYTIPSRYGHKDQKKIGKSDTAEYMMALGAYLRRHPPRFGCCGTLN